MKIIVISLLFFGFTGNEIRQKIRTPSDAFLFSLFFYHQFFHFLQGCGTPDLTQPDIQKKAHSEAILLVSLERKRMYEMIMLFVDSDDKPYTG